MVFLTIMDIDFGSGWHVIGFKPRQSYFNPRDQRSTIGINVLALRMITSRIGRIGRGRQSRLELFLRCTKPFCTAKTALSTSKPEAEASDDYKPGFFSRNPAVTLGGIALGIGLYLYRNAHNKSKFAALQEPFTEDAVISPYEAWELRSKNNLTEATFTLLCEDIFRSFPTRKATVKELDQFTASKLAEVCPNGLQKAHHLERVLALIEKDASGKVDIDAFLVALSLAVKGAVEDRLRCIYKIATLADASLVTDNISERSSEDDPEEMSDIVSRSSVEKILGLLLLTSQIPSEKRVVQKDQANYFLKDYEVASPCALLQAAIQANEKQNDNPRLQSAESISFEEFSRLFRGKDICVWGECFSSTKKKMKN
uniref:AlNc14C116G6546 protein n=1 Tax=Albugo laibachii Nc14 TaxID=890382 RepID=F0WJ12_9STRA|nr:AlNc14C116G6546 [Albugo laibachii Nc14]|eukprot:CCA21258.1 AlNc14C116G6546 [Albugo laibachii Nc14]